MAYAHSGLILHGAAGALDEFLMLLIGIVVAFGVVALTERQRKRRLQSAQPPEDENVDHLDRPENEQRV